MKRLALFALAAGALAAVGVIPPAVGVVPSGAAAAAIPAAASGSPSVQRLAAQFRPRVSVALCGASSAFVCASITGPGTLTIGGHRLPARLARTVIAAAAASGPCEDVATSGTIGTGRGDLRFAGTGVFCRVPGGTIVSYVVQFTGGTGRFARDFGEAAITTRPTGPLSLSTVYTGAEQWAGDLAPAAPAAG